MARRATKKVSVDFDDQAVREILSVLLAEFRQKGLTMDDLHNTYMGLAPAQLKAGCLADGTISEVDYDLAFKSLMEADLVKTGPMELYPNDPNSSVTVIMFFSKNEYSYLTEDGYKAATKTTANAVRRPRPAVQNVQFTGNTFNQSPVGIGETVSQTVDISAASADQMFAYFRAEIEKHIDDDQKRADILARLSDLENAQDKPSKMERYNQLVGAIGDHITVLSFALPPLLHWMMT